jgi:hypothetical protein
MFIVFLRSQTVQHFMLLAWNPTRANSAMMVLQAISDK